MNNNFLEEETRCEHFISKETKKLWAIEMDCLKQLISVCDKHGLTYFAGGGYAVRCCQASGVYSLG